MIFNMNKANQMTKLLIKMRKFNEEKSLVQEKMYLISDLFRFIFQFFIFRKNLIIFKEK